MNPLEEAVQVSLGTLPPLKVDAIESLDSNLVEEVQEWLNAHSKDTILFISQVMNNHRFITTTFIYREG